MAAYFTRTGGSPVFAPVAVKKITSSYSMQTTDFYVGCNGSNITVTLPVGPTPGQTYVIKDESGTSSITVNTSDSKTIDGSATQTFAASFMSVTFLWTGTGWSII
jgi:hypothetical protein